jgi:hypothetical protein
MRQSSIEQARRKLLRHRPLEEYLAERNCK